MLNLLAAAIMAAAAAVSDPAPAVQAPAAGQAAVPAKPAKPKLVCRSNLATGSRLGAERICKTQEEWDNITRDARDTVDNQMRHGMQISCPKNVGC